MANAALIVLTDNANIGRLDSLDSSWKAMAISPADLEVDQILFWNRDDNLISYIAFLQDKQPWLPVHIAGAPTVYLPNIALVEELLEPIFISDDSLRSLEAQGCLPKRNIEAALIADYGALFENHEPALALYSELKDHYITSRRSPSFMAQLLYLKAEGSDLLALAEEFTCAVTDNVHGEPLSELPLNWSQGWKQTDDQKRQLLSLLNSAFDASRDWSV